MTGRMSRRSSGWGEITGEEDNNEDKPIEKKDEEDTRTKGESGAVDETPKK